MIFLAIKLKSHGFFSCHETTETEKFSRHQLKTLGIQEGLFFRLHLLDTTSHHSLHRCFVSLGRHTAKLAYEEDDLFHSRHS